MTHDLDSVITDSDREDMARALFDIGAVKFGAFKLKLHQTNPDAPLSPIYFNMRVVRSHPQVLGLVASMLARYINTEGLRDTFDLYSDIPTGSTPIVAVLAYLTGIGMISPRKDSKGYGLGVSVDGAFTAGQRVLLLDDVVSHAESKLEAAHALTENGLVVRDILVVLDRQQGGAAQVAAAGYRLHALAHADQLVDIYRRLNLIDAAQYAQVAAYFAQERA